MRSILILICVSLVFTKSHSQNLVLNPGLDNYITCPGFGQFNSTFISSWDKPTIASSDYYNFNCAGIEPSVQMPHSGEGYAGVIAYNFGTEYREYITGTFLTPLVAGTTYNVSFYVSLNDGYIQAIEEMGAYISNTAPGPFSNSLHINVIPQVENTTGAITDTAGWKQITGQFVATGGEQFITIGNFHDDAGTTITQPGTSGSYGAYYFVDDVTVKMDNTSSLEHLNTSAVQIFSIGSNQVQVNISGNYFSKQPVLVKFFDMKGRQLFTDRLTKSETLLYLPFISTGIYIIELSDNQTTFRRKILLSEPY